MSITRMRAEQAAPLRRHGASPPSPGTFQVETDLAVLDMLRANENAARRLSVARVLLRAAQTRLASTKTAEVQRLVGQIDVFLGDVPHNQEGR